MAGETCLSGSPCCLLLRPNILEIPATLILGTSCCYITLKPGRVAEPPLCGRATSVKLAASSVTVPGCFVGLFAELKMSACNGFSPPGSALKLSTNPIVPPLWHSYPGSNGHSNPRSLGNGIHGHHLPWDPPLSIGEGILLQWPTSHINQWLLEGRQKNMMRIAFVKLHMTHRGGDSDGDRHWR